MITTKGKELIARYLAGYSTVWAGAIEFGVGSTAATVNDESLEFPFLRVPVEYTDYDPNTYEVIVRATIPSDVAGEFHEFGVFSSENFPDSEQGHRILLDYTGFDSVYAGNNAAISSTNARVGDTGYLLSAPNAGTAELRGFFSGAALDEFSGNDVFNLAYNYTSTGGTPTINIRFESTLSDYFLHSFTPTAGYNIESFTRQSVSQTGSPAWASVNAVYVEVTDQADVLLDGLMIEDTINFSTYGMIARQVIGTPITKPSGVETETTFKIALAF